MAERNVYLKIGIIDADLLDKGTRHPNLACEKISGYHKSIGNDVRLITDYNDIEQYNEVYLSKVFDFTKVPIDVFDRKKYPNLHIGGTGFFWTEAPNLPYVIEHHKPDYDLYNEFIESEVERGIKRTKYSDYLDSSIGFLTRGCFRKCAFCVNQKYESVFRHAPVSEFLDESRKIIYLWDDNVLGYPRWKEVFEELASTGKPFQFRQGMDMRLMTQEKAKVVSASKYYGEFIFAFDHIKDQEIIEEKLEIWQRYSNKIAKLYVLCGYDSQDETDIANTFERIKILMKHHCLPYIMRYEDYQSSKYRGLYITIARWCNQPNFLKKKSFREFCEANQSCKVDQSTLCSSMRSMIEFEKEHPDIAEKYFDIKWYRYGEKPESLY